MKRIFVSLNVTFFENTPSFEITSLQGETLHEDQFFNLNLSLSDPIPPILPFDSSMPLTEGNLNPREHVEQQHDKELLVYSRKPKSKYTKNLTSKAPKK